jgi:hypothetical protein
MLSRLQSYSAAGRIKSIEKFNNFIGNGTLDLSVCSIAPQSITVPLAIFSGIAIPKFHDRFFPHYSKFVFNNKPIINHCRTKVLYLFILDSFVDVFRCQDYIGCNDRINFFFLLHPCSEARSHIGAQG